jgi:hypothetical protein
MRRLLACRRRRGFTRVCLTGGILVFVQLAPHMYQRHFGDLATHRLVARKHCRRRSGALRRDGGCTALLAATIAFLVWLARAGSVVNFVSETVLIGFKAGVALQLASTQLPKLFGVKGGPGIGRDLRNPNFFFQRK